MLEKRCKLQLLRDFLRVYTGWGKVGIGVVCAWSSGFDWSAKCRVGLRDVLGLVCKIQNGLGECSLIGRKNPGWT